MLAWIKGLFSSKVDDSTTYTVRPTSVDEDDKTGTVDSRVEYLSEFDASLAAPFTAVAFRYNTILDVDTVRKGLARALDDFPAVGGRLNTTDNAVMTVDRMDEGVALTVRYSDDKDVCRIKCSKEWSQKDVFVPMQLGLPVDTPLFKAKLTLYPNANVSVLAIAFDHGLGDIRSMADFVNTWSYHCGGSLPEQKPNAPQELGNRRHNASGRPHSTTTAVPFSPLTTVPSWALWSPMSGILKAVELLCLIPLMIFSKIVSKVETFHMNKQGLNAYKSRVMHHIPKDAGDGWVSSWEAVIAGYLTAYALTTGKGWKSDLPLAIVMNARKHAKGAISKSYFGNASTAFEAQFTVQPVSDYKNSSTVDVESLLNDSDKLDQTVAGVATQLHGYLQSLRAAGPELLWHFDELDHRVKETGEHVPVLIGGLRLFLGKAIMINDWRSDWLNQDMGSGVAAEQLFIPDASMIPGFVVISTFDKDTWQLPLTIPSWEYKRFMNVIERMRLPLERIEYEIL